MKRWTFFLPFTILLIPAFVIDAPGIDWPSFYAGGKLAGTPGLYSLEASRAATTEVAGPRAVWAFLRPPAYGLLVKPLTGLPPKAFFYVWQLACIAALCASIRLLWPSVLGAIVPVILTPVWFGLTAGQDITFFVLLVAAGMSMLSQGRSFIAGALATGCLLKPHLSLLLPVWMLARRDWRFMLGVLSGASGVYVASAALNGIDWPIRFREYVLYNESLLQYAPTPAWASLAGTVWLPVMVGTVLLSAWFACRLLNAAAAFAAAIALSLPLAPRLCTYDVVMAVPAIVLLLRSVHDSDFKVLDEPLASIDWRWR